MRAKLADRLATMAALALLLAPAQAVTPAEALPESLFVTNWYTILIMNQRSGYSSVTVRRVAPGIETVERSVVRVRMDKETLTSLRTERRRYDAQLRLVEVEHHANQMGRVLVVRATRQGERLQVVRQAPEGEQRFELSFPPGAAQELQVLQAVLAGQLRPKWQREYQMFDADLGKLDTIQVRADEAVQEPRPGWLLTSQSKLLGAESRTWLGTDGTLLRLEIPAMMNLTQVLSTEEEALAETTPLLLDTQIRVNKNMPGSAGLRRVVLKATVTTGGLTGLIPATSRQKIERQDGALIVETKAETAPTSVVKLPVKAAAMQPYLVPTEMAQCTDPALMKQAREIIGGETDAWQAARKLLRWVYDSLNKMDSEPRPLSALEVFHARSGDCTEHAILLAALAQAVGIPARLAAGLVYDQQAYHYHAWTELWVGRWVEMDPTWGQEVVDAGHLQMAASELESAALARLSLASGRSMGNLALEVLEYR